MTKVFVGGSRFISRLSEEVRARMDRIMQEGFTVLVGDASGADKAAQLHMSERQYKSVVVYCTEGECRNNVGGWPVVAVPYAGAKGTYDYHVAKDVAMSHDADYGLMIWDGKSKGTFRNIAQLAEAGKKTVVWFLPARRFFTLSSPKDMGELLRACDQRSASSLAKSLRLGTRVKAERAEQEQPELPFDRQAPDRKRVGPVLSEDKADYGRARKDKE